MRTSAVASILALMVAACGCDKLKSLRGGDEGTSSGASIDAHATDDDAHAGDGAVATADAGDFPVVLQIVSAMSPPSVTQRGWGGDSTVSRPKPGFKFVVVEAKVTHTPCTDKIERFGDQPRTAEAGAPFGLKVGTDQAVLRLPDGRRLEAEGGGSDYDHMCLGCVAATSTSCEDAGAGSMHFWFVFVTDDDLEPETTVLEYRRVQAPLARAGKDGGT
jgi:hypothetical protein